MTAADGDAPGSGGGRGDVEWEIPTERLPEGFEETLDRPPPEPVPARPAATVVLLREGTEAPEVLLLRRVRSAGFVPGAWVFPGGRVDADDATPALVERIEGVDPARAAERLDLPPDADPPALAYWIAALREAFEETGILVARDPEGRPAPSAGTSPVVRGLRARLLEDEDLLPELLDRGGYRLDARCVEYIAHWITPEVEPRRYDTRFFAAVVDRRQEAAPHAGEMTEAVWLPPEEALSRHREGRLPMIFPTIRTLEDLAMFRHPREVLDEYAARPIRTILPTLVRTPTGVGLRIPDSA